MSHTLPTISKRYRLLYQLGVGGMGAVYSAIDRLTGQKVALKRVLSPTHVLMFNSRKGQADLKLALAQEFQILSSLRHPHIISVLDYGFDEESQPYFTMTLLDNPSNILDVGESQSLEGKVRLLIQILQALVYLHRRQILHRDLKPSNVLVDGDQVRVVDFGLSVEREAAKGVAGTVAYMAPEVLQGKSFTEAADLYAVGVIAYELLTGRHPFNIGNMSQLVREIIRETPDLSLISKMITQSQLPTEAPFNFHNRTTDLAGAQALPHNENPDKTLSLEGRSHLHDDRTRSALTTPADNAEITLRVDPYSDKDATTPDILYVEPESDSVNDRSLPQTALTAIIGRLLAKDPHDRYTDANLVIRDLSLAIGQPPPVESIAIRESFLQAATFVGRNEELAHLQSALEEITMSPTTGTAWLVGGESGVGKSRLLNEFRSRALVKGAQVLRGQATRERSISYQLWRDALRALSLQTDLTEFEASVLKTLVPDLSQLLEISIPDAPELDPQTAQDRFLSVIESVFLKQTQPLVVILEDLQWAGSESLAVINRLGRHIAHLPLMLVATYRDDEHPTLPKALPELQLLKLHRLDSENITMLSVSMLGPVGKQPDILDLLQRETEGNVFFLVEVMRALAEGAGRLDEIGYMQLPDGVFAGGVQEVLQRRLNHISAEARPLLQLAAVAGRQLDLNVLQAARQDVHLENWLNYCADAAVLDVQERQWRFAHDKLREHVLADLSPEQKQPLHAHIAQTIEKVYPDSPDQEAILAYHYGAAGHLEKEAYYTSRAGQQILKNGAYQEAVKFLERAIELHRQLTGAPLQEALLLRQLGIAYFGLGNLPQTRLHSSAALALLKWSVPATKRGLLLGILNQALRQFLHRRFPQWLIGRRPQERDAIAVALPAFQSVGQIDYFFGNAASFLYVILRALNLSERAGYSQGLALGYASMGVSAGTLKRHKMAQLYRRLGRQSAPLVDDPGALSFVYQALGLYSAGTCDWEDAIELLNMAIAIAQRIGNRRRLVESKTSLGTIAHGRAQYDLAYEQFSATYEIAVESGNIQYQKVGRNRQAQVLIRRGELQQALALLTQLSEEETENEDLNARVMNSSLLGVACVRAKQFEAARTHTDRALKLIMESSATAGTIFEGYCSLPEVYLRLWEAAEQGQSGIVADDALQSQAHRAVKKLNGYAKRFPIAYPRALIWQGLYFWLTGKPQKAHHAWAQCITFSQQKGMPYEEALASYEIARHPLDGASPNPALQQKAQAIFDNLRVYEATRKDTPQNP